MLNTRKLSLSLFSFVSIKCSHVKLCKENIVRMWFFFGHCDSKHIHNNVQQLKKEFLFRGSYSGRSLHSQKLERYLKNITVDNWLQKLNKDDVAYNYLLEKENIEENIKQLRSLKNSEESNEAGKEMMKLIDEDIQQYTEKLETICEKIVCCLIPKEDFEECNEIVIEISAGVGGMEAMLFTGDLRNMYCGYLDYRGWQYFIAENDETELGGVRHCSLLVSGQGVYSRLKHEAGVHRVQRVPVTEKGGRIHTSTASVAILPQPSDIEVNLKGSDLRIETKKASGAGGQHVNTTDSAVRITHIPTGIVIECQSGRSQHQNKANALKRLQAKIYERELTKADSNIRSQRKMQIGTSSRSEKIRTYNFRDDRISDHRLGINVHNLKEFLEGGESLDKLLNQLERWHYELRVQQFVDSLPT